MKKMLVLGAFAAVSIYALAATAYGIRTHDSAVRGWKAAANVKAPEKARSVPVGVAMPTREEWNRMLGQHPESAFQLAEEITSYLHNNVALGPGDVEGTIPERFRNAIGGGEEQAYCGDYSVFLREALDAVGIPARTVQLATSRQRPKRNACDDGSPDRRQMACR